jgi:hypothetical protein
VLRIVERRVGAEEDELLLKDVAPTVTILCVLPERPASSSSSNADGFAAARGGFQ